MFLRTRPPSLYVWRPLNFFKLKCKWKNNKKICTNICRPNDTSRAVSTTVSKELWHFLIKIHELHILKYKCNISDPVVRYDAYTQKHVGTATHLTFWILMPFISMLSIIFVFSMTWKKKVHKTLKRFIHKAGRELNKQVFWLLCEFHKNPQGSLIITIILGAIVVNFELICVYILR